MNTEVGRFSISSLRSPSFATYDPGVPSDPLHVSDTRAEQLGDLSVGFVLGAEHVFRDLGVLFGAQLMQTMLVVERLHAGEKESRKTNSSWQIC